MLLFTTFGRYLTLQFARSILGVFGTFFFLIGTLDFVELMRRAGGLSEDRYHKVRAQLKRWSKDVKSLRGENSSGPMTARAVLLLQDLDKEISQVSEGRHSLDDLTRALMRLEKASTADVLAISESLLGTPSEVLNSRLLR